MLVDTLFYCKREIIPLQRVDSAAKSNVNRKMVFILEVLRTLTLPLNLYRYLAICFIDKAHVNKMKK